MEKYNENLGLFSASYKVGMLTFLQRFMLHRLFENIRSDMFCQFLIVVNKGFEKSG
jgi:hypothetical protein